MPVLPLGLGLVAAAVREAGHSVELLNVGEGEDPAVAVADAVRRQPPGAIGISLRNIDDQNMRNPRFLLPLVSVVVAACRAVSGAPIVLGGAGYSIFPAPALTRVGADLGVRGEGEAILPALLARLEAGADPASLPGVYKAGRGDALPPVYTKDLDELPLPDESTWPWADPSDPELLIPVQTRRGCPLDCSYCATASIEGRGIRFRSPDRVAEHLARLASAGFHRFYFVDNTFNLPPSYALDLCRAVAARRLPIEWRCILYPYLVTEELAGAMAEAGCFEASLGFESGCARILRAMNKRFGPDDVRRASELLARHNIRRHGFLLLGGPGETPESVRESLDFARSLSLDSLKVTVGIRIYPNTSLAATAVEEGVVAPGEDLLEPRFYLAPALAAELPRLLAGVA